MAITYVSQGAAVAGTTSITTAAYGTGWAAGDLAVCVVASNHATTEATDPTVAGFINVGNLNGGGGAQGAGTGNRKLTFFTRECQTGDSTTPAIALTGGNVMVAAITIFRKGSTEAWVTPVSAFGAETTAATGWTEPMTSNPGFKSGDMLVAACAVRDSSDSSAEGFTATGATFSALTERIDLSDETGNDIALHVATASVTAGTASAAGTRTATHSTLESGVMGVLRVMVATFAQTPTDTRGITDTGLTKAHSLVITESYTRSDDVTPVIGAGGTSYIQTPTDNTGLTDNVARNIGLVFTDSCGLTDTQQISGSGSQVITDLRGLVDTVTFSGSRQLVFDDDKGLTDTTQILGSGNQVITDIRGLTDDILTTKTIDVSITDSTGITDGTVKRAHSLVISESKGSVDTSSAGIQSVLTFTATDTRGLTDANIASDFIEDQTDSTGKVDTQAFDRSVVVDDEVGRTDSISQAGAGTLNVTDTRGLTDATSISKDSILALTDEVGRSDNTVIASSIQLVFTDDSGSTDTQVYSRGVVSTDEVGRTDSIAIAGSGTQDLTDTRGLTDTVSITKDIILVFTDTTGSVDATVNAVSKQLVEDTGSVDTTKFDRSVVLTDDTGRTDSTAQSGAGTLDVTDVRGLTDDINFTRTIELVFTETKGSSDSTVNTSDKLLVFTDDKVSTDATLKTLHKIISDDLTLSDTTATYTPTKIFTDSVGKTDNIITDWSGQFTFTGWGIPL